MFNDFDKRMKNFENRNKLFLQIKTPVIIRLDGKNFSKFTKGLDKPFDDLLNDCMAKTTEYLLNNIDGCIFGYTQSDEISLLLVDYKNRDSQPYFDNNQQKLTSISASMATLKFNELWNKAMEDFKSTIVSEKSEKRYLTLLSKQYQAIFDARAFNLPKEEVLNYFIWRQSDCTKNSITMLAQSHFSHKQLQGKSGSEKQDMLMLDKGINWNDTPIRFKRGIAVYKVLIPYLVQSFNTLEEIQDYWDKFPYNYNKPDDRFSQSYKEVEEPTKIKYGVFNRRNKSFIDYEMPILTQDRSFIKGYE